MTKQTQRTEKNRAPNETKQRFVSLNDAARMLGGLSRGTLYNRMNDGDIIGAKLGRRRMITLKSLTAYMDKCEAAAVRP